MSDFRKEVMARLDDIQLAIRMESKDMLTIEECAQLTGYAVTTLREYASQRKIPHFRRGKRLFFSKSEVNRWLRECRIPTAEEIGRKAATYVAMRRRGYTMNG